MAERKKGAAPAWRGLALCYLVVLLAYLGACAFTLARDSVWQGNGTLAAADLALEDFALQGVLPLGEEEGFGEGTWFVSTDNDPQLVYQPADGAPFAPCIVTFDAAPSRPTGEIVLYYATKPGRGFADTRRVWAQLDANGAWRFDLTGKRVYALRLDPDSVSEGVLWQVNRISMGGRPAAVGYFIPDARGWLLLLGLPPVLWALLREGIGALAFALGPYLARRQNRKNNEKGT